MENIIVKLSNSSYWFDLIVSTLAYSFFSIVIKKLMELSTYINTIVKIRILKKIKRRRQHEVYVNNLSLAFHSNRVIFLLLYVPIIMIGDITNTSLIFFLCFLILNLLWDKEILFKTMKAHIL